MPSFVPSRHRALPLKTGIALLAGLGMAVLTASAAQAQVFSDTSSTHTTFRSVAAPMTYFSNVATSTSITSFSILNQMTTAGSLEFLIFNDTTNTLLYMSAPVAFGADTGITWKQSPTFTFTLVAGQTYDFGALANVNANYGFNTDGDLTQNGLTSAQSNQNVENFASPDLLFHAGARIPIILNAAAPVPEASTTVSLGLLLALGMGGLVVAGKRRKAGAGK